MKRSILFLAFALISISALCEQRSIISQIEPKNKREERILRHYFRDYRYGKRGYFGAAELGAIAGDIGCYIIVSQLGQINRTLDSVTTGCGFKSYPGGGCGRNSF
jgi:hypothetical protein